MIKKLLSCVGEYKKYAILTPVIMIGEVLMEVTIPLVMAQILDVGIATGNTSYTVKMGMLMICMALFSLLCGALGGKFAAQAGMGFAKNVRKRLFDRVQDFSCAEHLYDDNPHGGALAIYADICADNGCQDQQQAGSCLFGGYPGSGDLHEPYCRQGVPAV